MIGAMQSFSAAGMSGMNRMQGPPPSPPPQENMEDKLSQLETAVDSGEIDTDELAVKLSEAFGEDAEGIVSEDGEVDFAALSELLIADRTEKLTTDLTEKFGEDAAQFVTDAGEVDHEGLSAYLEEAGFEAPQGGQGGPPPPPPGGFGGQPMGYGDQGETRTSGSGASFLSLLA